MRRMGSIGAGPAALLAITMFFWGTAFRATAIGGRHASPVVFSTLRAVPATVALLGFALLTGARLPRDRRTVLLGAVCGVLVVTVTFEGIAESTKLSGAGISAVLINSVPFFTVVFARLFLVQRTPRLAVGGLVIGFAGVVVMVSSQLSTRGSAAGAALGSLIALMAAAGFAVGALLIAHEAGRDPSLDMLGFTAVQYVFGSLALVALMFLYGHPGRTDWSSSALIGSAAWVAFGSSAGASLCFNLALRRVSAPRATSWQFLAPVVAVVVEAVRGNLPGALVLAGMVLAIGGVSIVSLVQADDAAVAPATLESDRLRDVPVRSGVGSPVRKRPT